MSDKIEAVFIDRDGTIGGSDEVIYPGAFTLYPDVKESIQHLKSEGILIFSFTNQPGISRGEATTEAFKSELIEFGFDHVYLCPHQHGKGCLCRKPEPGMLLNAAKDHHLDLKNCIVIGDRWTDMVAASKAECKSILVKTGAGQDAILKYRHKWSDIDPTYTAENFVKAVQWILKMER